MVLAAAVLLAHVGVAPNFDTFLERAVGKWQGASYCWQRAGSDELLALGVAPGYISVPTPSSTEVAEVMRSCGGAVQGVGECRKCQPAEGTVALNRQVDGTSFFTYGSWAVAPTLLSSAAESDLLTSPDCFGLSVCLAHADETRTRVLAVVSDQTILCCDVAIEGRQPPIVGGAAPPMPAAVEALLGSRLQCVVDANAWEGGASRLVLSGSCDGAPAWMNARTKWALEETQLEGGTPLVPDSQTSAGGDVIHLPGGAWVRTAPTVGVDAAAGLLVEVGSINPDAAEVKAIEHVFSAEGEGAEAADGQAAGALRLSRVSFSKVTALE